MKLLLHDLFRRNKATKINIGDYTSHIQFGNSNNTIFPNQYYAIASACYDYATELSRYCTFCKEFVNTEENKIKLLETKGNKHLVSDLLCKIIGTRLDEIDREMFEKFYCDEKYRPGRSFFNKDKIRNTDDIFDSNLLKIIQVPDASSSFLGKLIRMLVENNDVYSSLKDYVNKKQRVNKQSVSTTKFHSLPFPAQIIYYGVPGCGKSHSVDAKINTCIAAYNVNKDSVDKLVCDKQVIRTVFHPDYCNTDFIGQIMPRKNSAGEFKYEFKPGPFAKIIRKAYLNPQKPYFLVIEEINRGNASAIFGETFQLLDRYATGENSKTEEVCNENYDYSEGWSRYPINNDELNEYILQGGESFVTEKEPDVEYDSDFPEGPRAAIKIPSIGLHFSSYCGIRLPPNLSIYATMNTSDQNVFTLDNAFQRRWTMKQISSELEKTGASADQYNQTIKRNPKDKDGNNVLVDTNVKWGDFRKAVNDVIMESALENGLSSMEDKRLGGWFYVKSDNFAEKVLKYLWDDAFKFSRSDHFGEIRTLEELVEKFNEQGFDVFTDASIRDLQTQESSNSSSDDV